MAGMSIKDLFVTLGVKADVGALNKFDTGLNRVRSSIRSLSVLALSNTIGLGALTKVIKDTVNLGDDIAKSAEKFGIATDVFQGIQYAGYQANLPIESLDMAFKKMSMTLKQLGRTDITTEQAFMQLADRFHSMPNGVLKTATAVKWFGRAGADLIPLLNQGSEALYKYIEQAKELGWTMGEENIRAMEKADTQFKTLFALFRGLKILITSAVLPSLSKYIDTLIKYVSVNREIIKTRIVELFNTLVGVMRVLLGIANALWKVFSTLSRVVGGVDNAIRILIGSFLIWQGLKIVTGIGLMVQSFIGLAVAIKGSTVAMGALNLAMSPILITVGLIATTIAGLILIIEDLYVYFKGGDSVFGSGLDYLITRFGKLSIFIRTARAGIEGFIWLLNKIPGVKIGSVDVSEGIENGTENINTTPKTSPIKNLTSSNQVNMNAPITLNIQGNADPDKTAEITYSAVKDSIDQMLRETFRATAPVAD